MSDVLLKLDINEKPCLKGAANEEALKQELLAAHLPDDESLDRPKKGTKAYICSQIEHLCSSSGLVVEESNRELMRLSKAELKAKLARYMETASERRMRATVGLGEPALDAPETQRNREMNVFVLRMLHDTVLGTVEKTYEAYGSKYTGFSIEGLCQRLQEAPHTERVDEILVEIAEEQPDLMDMFDSPYAKLALCWLMAAVTVARRKTQETVNGLHRATRAGDRAAPVGRRPEATDGGQRVQPLDLWTAESRKIVPDECVVEETGGAESSGSGDFSVRGLGALPGSDDPVLRPEILLQRMAIRTV